MAEGEEKNEPIVRRMTESEFKAICRSTFDSYVMSDENPVVALTKELKDIQKQIEDATSENQLYQRILELIIKKQEYFLEKVVGLPKQNTRSVGVYVNFPSEGITQKPVSTQLHNLTLSANALAESPLTSTPTQMDDNGKKSSVSGSLPSYPRESSNSRAKNYKRDGPSLIASSSVFPKQKTAPIPTINVVQPCPPVKYHRQSPKAGKVHLPHPQHYAVIRNPVPVQALVPGKTRVDCLPPQGTVLVPGAPLPPRPGFKANPIRRNSAPLPAQPMYLDKPNEHPPKPCLTLIKSEERDLHILTWDMPLSNATTPVESYEIFSSKQRSIDSSTWKKIRVVKSSKKLPMSCSVNIFKEGRYYFAIRACDTKKRVGPFSNVASMSR